MSAAIENASSTGCVAAIRSYCIFPEASSDRKGLVPLFVAKLVSLALPQHSTTNTRTQKTEGWDCDCQGPSTANRSRSPTSSTNRCSNSSSSMSDARVSKAYLCPHFSRPSFLPRFVLRLSWL